MGVHFAAAFRLALGEVELATGWHFLRNFSVDRDILEETTEQSIHLLVGTL